MQIIVPAWNEYLYRQADGEKQRIYTGVELLKELVSKGIRACGTVRANRKGFPSDMKNVKEWAECGAMRWNHNGENSPTSDR